MLLQCQPVDKSRLPNTILYTLPLSLQTPPCPGTAPWIHSVGTRQTCCSCRPQKPGRTDQGFRWTVDCCPSQIFTDTECTFIYTHSSLVKPVYVTRSTRLNQYTIGDYKTGQLVQHRQRYPNEKKDRECRVNAPEIHGGPRNLPSATPWSSHSRLCFVTGLLTLLQ